MFDHFHVQHHVELLAQGLRADFYEQVIKWCNPAGTDTVVTILTAEKGLVGQRCIGEIPGMGVEFIKVTDGRIETTEAQTEACRQCQRVDEGLLDIDFDVAVMGMQADRGLPIEKVIHVGRRRQLGLPE